MILNKNKKPFVRFLVDESQHKQTQTATDLKNPQWNEKISLFVGLEECIKIEVEDQDAKTSELIGSSFLFLKNLTQGQNVQKLDLTFEKEPAGTLTVTLNCTINKDYEKQAGFNGTLIISGLRGDLIRDSQFFGKMDPQVEIQFDSQKKLSSIAVDTDTKPSWTDRLIFGVKVKVVNAQSKERVVLGIGSYDVKEIIHKHGKYTKEPIKLVFENEQSGTLFADIEYRSLDALEDPKLYELKQQQGKVTVSNISAQITRETEIVGKIDPYCVFRLLDVEFKTVEQKEAGKEPKWADKLSFEMFSYQKHKQMQIKVHDKDVDTDDLVGEATVDFQKYIETYGEHPNQSVEILFKGKSSGKVFFTVTSQENKELKELKELEAKVLKDLEEKKLKAEKAEKERIQKEEDEKNRIKKEKEEQEKANKELEEKEEKERANKELEEKANKELEEKENQKKLQDDNLKKKQQLERESEEEKQRKDKVKQQEQEELLNQERKRLEALEKIVIEKQPSILKRRSVPKYQEFKVAQSNIKNGFGMSEFQSVHSLQYSIPATSFPKGSRFQNELVVRTSSPYTLLPSIFDNSKKKGTSFGFGNRGLSLSTLNPGPGAYELANKLKKFFTFNPVLQLNKDGFSFGVSRESCKNAVNIGKNDMQYHSNDLQGLDQSIKGSQSMKEIRSSIKLPSITPKVTIQQQDTRLSAYPQHPFEQNYHFSRKS